MKNFYCLTIFLIAFSIIQENIKYQKPSKQILDLVFFQYDEEKNYMVFI